MAFSWRDRQPESPPHAFESRDNGSANGSEVGSRVSKPSSRSDVAVGSVRLDQTRHGSSNSCKQRCRALKARTRK
jgi:hypothetical protein